MNPLPSSLPVLLHGETLHLLPQRALFWPAQRMLIVADVHFGKAAAFRAHGIPVPRGTTSQNIDLLDTLLAAHHIEHIVFLGDFFHARSGRAPATLAAIAGWRAAHSTLRLTLVRGNHDAHAGDPPAALSIACADEPYRIGALAFCHHPQVVHDAYVLAGHMHPVHRLSLRGDTVRLPCFSFDACCGVLPSFGAFTGGHPVQSTHGRRLFVTTGDSVFAVPARDYRQ